MGKKGDPPPQDPAIPELQSKQEAFEERLSQEIVDVHNAIKAADTEARSFLQQQIDELPKTASIDAAVKALEKSEEQNLEKLHETIRAEILEEIAAAMDKAGAAAAGLGELRTDFENRNKEFDTKLSDNVDELMKGIEGSHNLLSTQIDEVSGLAHQEVLDVEERLTSNLANELPAIADGISAVQASLEFRCGGLKKEIEECCARIEQSKVVMQKADMDLASACEAQFSKLEEVLRQEQQDGISGVKDRADELFNAMSERMQPKLDSIAHMAWMLDNMYTRTVTWQIRGFRHKLAELLEGKERVLHSPPFSVCAQPEMALDMLAAPEEEPMLDNGDFIPPLPVAGSCSIRLWAFPGCHMKWRITLGEGSAAVSRRFENTFEAGEVMDSMGRASFQMKNLCQLDTIWVRKPNTVNVTFELLELHHAETIGVPAPLEIEEEFSVGAVAPEEADQDKDTHPDRQAADTALERTLDDSTSVDGIFTSRALTSDFLMQEKMQSQLQVLKNRLVRRVEWVVQGCSLLLERMKVGEMVESPIFSAAGVDKMQLQFYPRGCEVGDKTSEHGQACALFLRGPYRTTIRGVLSVGTNTRPFEQRFQHRGEVGGRAKFCSLGGQVDMQDTVTLSLELEDVEVDLPEMSGSLLFRQRGATGAKGAPSPAKGATGAKGSMRMKREDPTKSEEVVRCISLPALNPRQQFLPKVAAAGRSGQRSR